MRGAVIHNAPPIAAEIESPIGDLGSQLGPTKFSVAWKAWYPQKTAEELATRANVGIGTAKHWLRGTRKPSAIAMAATLNEIAGELR